jgi:hypothetical protein
VRDQLDPGNERGRVGEVHPEEALTMLEVGHQTADRNGRGVGADHRLAAGGLLDAAQHGPFDVRLLQYGLFDQVSIGHRLGQTVGGPQVLPDQFGRARIEKSLLLELLGLSTQSIEMAKGDVRGGVDDHHVQPGHCQDLGDTAAHVAGADYGDLGNLGSHAVHNLSSVRSVNGNCGSGFSLAIVSCRCRSPVSGFPGAALGGQLD